MRTQQSKKKKQNTQGWEKVKAMGKTKFILVTGVLTFALVGLVSRLISVLFKKDFSMALFSTQKFWLELGQSLIIFALMGVLWGIWTWRSLEKKSKK